MGLVRSATSKILQATILLTDFFVGFFFGWGAYICMLGIKEALPPKVTDRKFLLTIVKVTNCETIFH